MAKLFLTAMIVVLIGSILPMMIPFYAFLLSMSSYGLVFGKNLNENYRVQIVGYSVMIHPSLEVIEKKGIFERKLIHCFESDIRDFEFDEKEIKDDLQALADVRIKDAKDIVLESEKDSTMTLTLFYEQFNRDITFDKKTKKLIQVNENN